MYNWQRTKKSHIKYQVTKKHSSDIMARNVRRISFTFIVFIAFTLLDASSSSMFVCNMKVCHIFMRLKSLMIFMGSLSLSISLPRHSCWALYADHQWRSRDCTGRKHCLSRYWILNWEVSTIHPRHWTNLFTPPSRPKRQTTPHHATLWWRLRYECVL